MLAFFDTLLQRELTGQIENDDDENSDGSLYLMLIVLLMDGLFFSLSLNR
jgi:hypothetical protein